MTKLTPLGRLRKSVWLFPGILLLLLVVLTSLQLSGSSVGLYYPVLYGENQKSPNLIANQPLTVRSDEWLVNTQLTVAQAAIGYPHVNPNINGGSDMSVVGDAPYKDWSAVFRPQNLAFFVFPLAYALAFKWWLLLLLVIVSCYFFVLRFFPGKRLLASLLSTAVGCSPFLFWWYQTATFASIFYGFFIILLGMRIINGEKVSFLGRHAEKYSRVLYVFGLAYLLIAFALILYPPFQIPVALCVLAFLAGYLIEKIGFARKLFSRQALTTLTIFGISLFLVGATVFTFLHTRSQAVNAIQHSVYPGSREISGGGAPVFQIFSTFLQPQLERDDRAFHYYDNPSEASNFILLLPFLLIPGFVLLYFEYRQSRKFRWSLLFTQLLAVLFIANLFRGELQPLYNLLFLNEVAHPRLFIGLGFLGVLQLILLMKSLDGLRLDKKRLYSISAIYTLVCLAALLWSLDYVRDHWPLFISNSLFIVFLVGAFAGTVFLFLSRRFLLGASVFCIFSLLGVAWIHPLYRGIEPLYPSKLSIAINSVSGPSDTWVTLDDVYFENAASMAGRKSLSGIQPYPNLELWRQIEGPRADFVYNRYAHILFSSDVSSPDAIRLARPDNFHVKFACTPFVKKNVQYALATHPVNNDCIRLVKKVNYPSKTFYLYRVEQ
jgi:hypothetical protein